MLANSTRVSLVSTASKKASNRLITSFINSSPFRIYFMKRLSSVTAIFLATFLTANAQLLKLQKGDHICLIGNALADRMQLDGWLETLIYARFPQDDLVFRNLAVSGDEVAIRHRSENFGSPDEWLARTKADVIFAFFGFNESFKGPEGLEKFKKDLGKFLTDT